MWYIPSLFKHSFSSFNPVPTRFLKEMGRGRERDTALASLCLSLLSFNS